MVLAKIRRSISSSVAGITRNYHTAELAFEKLSAELPI